jgi:hypothetical protein
VCLVIPVSYIINSCILHPLPTSQNNPHHLCYLY